MEALCRRLTMREAVQAPRPRRFDGDASVSSDGVNFRLTEAYPIRIFRERGTEPRLAWEKARGNMSPLTRRRVLGAAALLPATAFARSAHAQARWPDRSVTLVVPFAPGESQQDLMMLADEALAQAERNERQRIMVLGIGGTRTGFIVDQVVEVLRIPRSAMQPAPRLSERQMGIIPRVANLAEAKRMVLILEAPRLLEAGEVAALEAAALMRKHMRQIFEAEGDFTIAFARNGREALDQAELVAQQVGLAAQLDKPAADLTVAGRKRLELARALATKPRLLLLDEVLA
eukprot:gene48435-59316_t